MAEIETLPKNKSLTGWIPWTLIVASFLGFIDTAYLTAEFFLGEAPKCVLFSGCDLVTTSVYSKIGPVPVSLLGLLFYVTILVLLIAYFDRRRAMFLRLISALSVPAFLFTLWLVFLQLFVIKAICVYCMFSALTSSTIFIVSALALRELAKPPVAMS